MTNSINPGFLDECEREALHEIGAIQPFGALLGGHNSDPTLRYVSANLTGWSWLNPDVVLDQPLAALSPWLSNQQIEHICAAIAGDTKSLVQPSGAKHLLASLCSGPHGKLDGLLSLGSRNWLLELQPALPAEQQVSAYRPVPHSLYRRPRSDEEWTRLCDYLAEQMRVTSSFDRVMVYRFLEDGSGEVIAESLAAGLPPYLGLRYPASDIPQIARLLYMANRHRQIPDAAAKPVAILSHDETTLDLTLSDLRAVSPVHVDYLHNMGATASLSFPVMVRDHFWGLIACHNQTPLALPFAVRERCAEMVQAFALGIASYQTSQRLQVLGRSDRDIRQLIDRIGALRSGMLPDNRLQEELLNLVGASGAALTENDADGGGFEEVLTLGETPSLEQIRELMDWLRVTTMEPVFSTDALSALFPPATRYATIASGMLAVRVGRFTEGARFERGFLWWRPEKLQRVQWAGDPRKSAMFASQSRTLSPRSSFDAWVEISREQAEPWSDLHLLNAKKFRSLVLRDINADLLRD
ncbi:MAG: hypothetical protein N838_04565 [Thiohalocapsa sp. PB-PSB1]|nr:MAG: hypothetical protein N838_04565 [Thiohalocapsa sp. PB-PSB1]